MVEFFGTQATDSVIVHVEAFLEDLIPGFLEDRKKDVETIVAACRQGDYQTIRTLGHIMHGCGAGYGFDAITDIGRSLEQATKDENPPEILKLADELATYLERVEILYE